MRNETLQAMAREYLSRLRYMAKKHDLLSWLNSTIHANKDGSCEATEKEVRMLSRLCDDANIKRTDVPKMLGKSYRRYVDDDDFGKIRTNLENRAIYDKVSTLLLAGKLNKRNKDKKNG
jgi:hypothetical protein